MTHKKPTIGIEESLSAQSYIERLKSKGFLPELDQASVERRKKAITDKLKNIDASALPLPANGKPFTAPFGNFGQGWANTRTCNEQDTEASTPSFKKP